MILQFVGVFCCHLCWIIIFSNRTNHLFEIERSAIIFIRLHSKEKQKNSAVAYGGVCYLCECQNNGLSADTHCGSPTFPWHHSGVRRRSISCRAPPHRSRFRRRLSFQCLTSRRRWPGEPASCARSSASTAPGSRTNRKPGHGNRWRAPGSRMWWSWCCGGRTSASRTPWCDTNSGWCQWTDGYQSPNWISCLFLPSNDTQAVFLASGDSVIWLRVKRRTVRKASPCGLHSTDGGDSVGFSHPQEIIFLWGLIWAEKSKWTSEAWWWRYRTIFFISKNDRATLKMSRCVDFVFVCDKSKSAWLARSGAPETRSTRHCILNQEWRFQGSRLNRPSSVPPMKSPPHYHERAQLSISLLCSEV